MPNQTSNLPKIAIHILSLHGGGAEKSAINMSNALIKRGCNVEIVVLQIGPLAKENYPNGVKIVELGTSTFRGAIPKLTRYFKEAKPDIVVTHLHQSTAQAVICRSLSRQKFKIVQVFQNYLSIEIGSKKTWLEKKVFLFSKFFNKVEGKTAVSLAASIDAEQVLHLSRGDVTFIPNIVVGSNFFDYLDKPSQHKWMNDGNGPVIVNLGRLVEAKDQDTLIRSLKIVREKIDARLVIFGQGELRPNLERLILELSLSDVVDMPGFYEFPKPEVRDSRLFVLSSIHEGMPGVLIEALAIGTPAISTDCPSGPSEILHDSSFGALVPMRDPESMATAILSELEKEKISPPKESWEPFTEESCIEKYIKVFEETLGSKVTH